MIRQHYYEPGHAAQSRHLPVRQPPQGPDHDGQGLVPESARRCVGRCHVRASTASGSRDFRRKWKAATRSRSSRSRRGVGVALGDGATAQFDAAKVETIDFPIVSGVVPWLRACAQRWDHQLRAERQRSREPRRLSSLAPSSSCPLVLLAPGAGLGLAVHVGERRDRRGAAFLLVLVLLRLLLFFVASHLTFGHGVLRFRV